VAKKPVVHAKIPIISFALLLVDALNGQVELIHSLISTKNITNQTPTDERNNDSLHIRSAPQSFFRC
jgi:hypothetical protein